MAQVDAAPYRRATLAERIAANTAAEIDRHRADPLDVLREIERAKFKAAGALAHGRMSDNELRALADRRAGLLQQRADLASGDTPAAQLAHLNDTIEPLQGRPFDFEGDAPQADQLRGFLARARCPLWWRRQLRRAAVRQRETEANARAEVSAARRQPYVTHDTAARHRQRALDAAAMMAATELENDAGQVLTLADLSAASVSNPAIRRGELMTRITGCERWAQAMGLRGVFLTLTAPSRFHRVHRTGQPNDKHDGSTPRDAQGWLSSAWARARAKLQRLGVQVFGFRVAEPHHDGCPHWHALLWAAPGQLWRAVRIIKRAWLKLEGQEPGARAHRCKAVLMRPGGASGYIAKYVAKNIDDAGALAAEGHRDDDYSPDVPAPAQADAFGGTAQRVQAWASAWGIRQFQAIGQPPVTVWRELRRIEELAGSTPRLARALEAVNRDGTKRADWASYCLAQGGMNTGRNYLLRLALLDKLKHGRYETTDRPCIVGVTDSTGPGDIQASNRREWKPRGTWTSSDRTRGIWAPRGAPWTRVNNCTHRGARDLLQTLQQTAAPSNFGPWGGLHQKEPTPWLPEPPAKSRTTSRLCVIQRIASQSRAT